MYQAFRESRSDSFRYGGSIIQGLTQLPLKGRDPMTAQSLPDKPNYCFVPTALVALTVMDAEEICDKLNRRLGLDRDCDAVHARRGGRPRQRLALRPKTSHYSEITLTRRFSQILSPSLKRRSNILTPNPCPYRREAQDRAE